MVLGQREPPEHNADLRAETGNGVGMSQTTTHQGTHRSSIWGSHSEELWTRMRIRQVWLWVEKTRPQCLPFCHLLTGPDWEELAWAPEGGGPLKVHNHCQLTALLVTEQGIPP